MKPGALVALRSAARFYIPLLLLFTLSFLATRAAGGGVGLSAGIGVALALALHVLVFGAGAARVAFPAPAARAALSLGLVIALSGAGFKAASFAPQLAEAGLFMATVGGSALALKVLVGRAPTLRDEDW